MSYKDIVKGFDIVGVAQTNNKVVDYAKKGALKGKYLGFPNIHEHYSMSLPGVTDWTGMPQSGKSEVLMECLFNTSMFYGWKHLLYMPDVGNSTEIVADLIHKHTGKSFEKRYKNHITEEEISRSLPWVMEHFLILTKMDLSAKITPYEFWELAVKIKNEVGLQTASIDAWKDMSHKREKEFGRTDQYLEDCLSYRNAMAEENLMHFHDIIHPTRTDKGVDGHRKPPTMYDMKGGTEWANSGKNLISVHRPYGAKNMVEIYFNKIKPRSIGSTGMTELHFDIALRKYYVDDNGAKRYATKDIYKMNAQQVMDMDEDADDLPF